MPHMQAYFDQQATIIQKCWRGYFSRSRIHDYYKRKAYLASVAAANAAVRAGMEAELQEALEHQQQTAESTAKQHFSAQVGPAGFITHVNRWLTSARCLQVRGPVWILAGAWNWLLHCL